MKKLIALLFFMGFVALGHAQLLAPKGIKYSLDGTNLTLLTPTAAEFNRISGLISTSTELNLLHGVTTSATEFNYLIGATSNIQAQLNLRATLISPTFTGIVKLNTDTLATQAYARAEGGGGGGTWGSITGTITSQTDLNTALGLKANLASPTFTGTVGGITASMVGLGNVTNESKATMFTSPTFTGTVGGVTASMVGLGNVTNESKTTMFTSPAFTGSYATIGTDTLSTRAYARAEGGAGGMTYPTVGIALSDGSAWSSSIADNSSNWNTAYSWGNHASGGYAAAGQTMYIGTTGVTLNRASNPLTLAGITLSSPTFTGTTTIATPFTLGAISVTSTGTQLNYLSNATGTTGTNTTNLVFSTSPALTTPTVTTSIVGDATFSAFNTTTTNLSLGGAATTMTVGGTPTGAITHSYSANTTASGSTKTVNLGTGGASGSTSNINIGSASGGTTTINSPTLALGTGSLTMTGSLGATGAGKVTKGWFTDVEITNLPTINGGTLKTGLGVTTAGDAFLTLVNPSAITFARINADNTVTARSAANFKTDLSLENVTNESKATMFTAPTFTGHPTIEGITSTGATGTSNLVFSASPTFSGTPLIGTFSVGKLYNTTATLTAGANTDITLTGVTTEPFSVQIFDSDGVDITESVKDSTAVSSGVYHTWIYSTDAKTGAKIKVLW